MEEYIHLNTIYAAAWEYMLWNAGEYGKKHTPRILPPPLHIIDNKDEIIECNDMQFREMCKFDNSWYKIDRICFINPIDYAVTINVDSYRSIMKSNFDNKISFEMLYYLILHDMMHELCHYIHSYRLWESVHNDDDSISIEEAYDRVIRKIRNFGNLEDETENEKRTLRYWREIFEFQSIIPKAYGQYTRFLKRYSGHKIRYYAAVIYDYAYTSDQFRNHYDSYNEESIRKLELHWYEIIDEIISDAEHKKTKLKIMA